MTNIDHRLHARYVPENVVTKPKDDGSTSKEDSSVKKG